MFLEQFEQQDSVLDEKALRLNIELLASPMTLSQQKAAKQVFARSNQAADPTVPSQNQASIAK